MSLEKEGVIEKIDVSVWLSVNKLNELEFEFLRRQITVEELIDFSTNDFNELCLDLGLDTLQKKRLLSAIEMYKEQKKKYRI